MERREFVGKLGVGSAVALVSGGVGALAAGAGPSGPPPEPRREPAHDHSPVSGPLATATVAFGSWKTDLPIDRYPNLSPGANNAHQMIPYQVAIKPGGTVTFAIGGFHQVIIYGPGTQPENVVSTLTRLTTGTPAGGILINDPTNRIYAGPDPSTLPRERVEVVKFPEIPGRYLVICGIQAHFVNDQMYGWVRVRPADDDAN